MLHWCKQSRKTPSKPHTSVSKIKTWEKTPTVQKASSCPVTIVTNVYVTKLYMRLLGSQSGENNPWILHRRLDLPQEQHSLASIDQSVVVSQSDVHHRSDHNLEQHNKSIVTSECQFNSPVLWLRSVGRRCRASLKSPIVADWLSESPAATRRRPRCLSWRYRHPCLRLLRPLMNTNTCFHKCA